MSEPSAFRAYAADHRHLLDAAARHLGCADPVAFDADEFQSPLIRAARKGPLVPLDGVMVRDWDPDCRRTWAGVQLGMRLYDVQGVRFAWVNARFDYQKSSAGLSFFVVDRGDYPRLYRIARRCRRDQERPCTAPVLPADQLDTLWRNTVGFLDNKNLRRLRTWGGKARRGLLLSGPPGNGKTSACRWLWQECRRRRWDWRLVTPDDYREARAECNPAQAVRNLFALSKRGIVFFDDFDLGLRDRDRTAETDDQAIFLSALDGLSTTDGVVYVFTTNCDLKLIDPAFRRPGRIDVLLHFPPPDAALRRKLIERWHPEIVAVLDVRRAVNDTEDHSFAEIDELKNLLILRRLEVGVWDWAGARQQFAANRDDLKQPQTVRPLGFAVGERSLAGV